MNEISLSDYNSLLEVAVALNLGATVFRSNIEKLLSDITQYKTEKLLRTEAKTKDLEERLEKLSEAEDAITEEYIIKKRKEEITEISTKITTNKLFVERAEKMMEKYKKNDRRIKIAKYIIRFIAPVCAFVSIGMLFVGVHISSLNNSYCRCLDFIVVLLLILPAFISFGLHYWHLKHEKVEFDRISEIINGDIK